MCFSILPRTSNAKIDKFIKKLDGEVKFRLCLLSTFFLCTNSNSCTIFIFP